MNFMKKSLLVLCGGLILLGNSALAMNFNFDKSVLNEAKKTAGELNNMTNNLRSLGQFVSETVLPQFDQTLGSFNQTLANTNYTVEKLEPILSDVTATVNKALDFAGSKKKLRLFTKFLKQNAQTIDNTLSSVDKTVIGVNATIVKGEKLVEKIEKAVDKGAEKIDSSIEKGEKAASRIVSQIDAAVSRGENITAKLPDFNLKFDKSLAEKGLVLCILIALGKVTYDATSFCCEELKKCWV